MTEPNQVVFPPEPVRPPGGGRSLAVRMGIVAGSAVLFVVGAVAVMGASPAPAATTAPDQTTDPAATVAPGTTTPNAPTAPNGGAWSGPKGGMHGGFGMGGMRGGPGVGFRDITITNINDSDISLKTDDGWTRTIAVTSDTKITKGGQTIARSDLQVGDQVHFSETKNTDGTYTITEITVVLPTIAGQVTAIDGSTITVTVPGGTTATIHVSGDTTFTVDGVTGAKLSDIKVNSFVIAEGTQQSDGSLDASVLHSGFGARDGNGGPGHWDGNKAAPNAPNASPAPSTSAG
jgi:hypothetical protein